MWIYSFEIQGRPGPRGDPGFPGQTGPSSYGLKGKLLTFKNNQD